MYVIQSCCAEGGETNLVGEVITAYPFKPKLSREKPVGVYMKRASFVLLYLALGEPEVMMTEIRSFVTREKDN